MSWKDLRRERGKRGKDRIPKAQQLSCGSAEDRDDVMQNHLEKYGPVVPNRLGKGKPLQPTRSTDDGCSLYIPPSVCSAGTLRLHALNMRTVRPYVSPSPPCCSVTGTAHVSQHLKRALELGSLLAITTPLLPSCETNQSMISLGSFIHDNSKSCDQIVPHYQHTLYERRQPPLTPTM